MSWLQEDLKEAEKTKTNELPNPKAPRMVKVEQLSANSEPKKPVQIKLDSNVHEQLSRLVMFEKLAGNKEAAITSMFMDGLDMYLKKNKLPKLSELEEGAIISQDAI